MDNDKKNKMELITIIVPVYKVEGYIRKCIDSIIDQTYRQLEIILVDDGSPDNCGKICDEYACKDKRVKVIHKKNEGVSKAREDAIKIAKGEYIAFVDSDDWLDDDCIMNLYSKIKQYDADWVSCNFKEVGGNKYSNSKLIEKEQIITCRYDLYSDYLNLKFYTYVIWGKLFKTSLLKDYKFQRIKMGEDTCCMMDVFLKTKKAVLIEYKGYNYLTRENSVTNHASNEEIYDRVISINYITKIIEDTVCELKQKIHEEKARVLLDVYIQTLMSDDDNKKDVYLRKICKEIRRIKLGKLNINKKQKRNLFLIKYFENMFRIILQTKFPQYKR